LSLSLEGSARGDSALDGPVDSITSIVDVPASALGAAGDSWMVSTTSPDAGGAAGGEGAASTAGEDGDAKTVMANAVRVPARSR